jgi:uncharacterized protein (TIGR02145 family)
VQASTNLQQASNAVDCNTWTRWESNHEIENQWIYVDLGTPTPISRVVLNWEAANAKDYTIEGSNDQNFANRTILATRTNMPNSPRIDDITGLSGTFRYVRMYGTSRNLTYGYSLWEFEVYDAPISQFSLTSNVLPAGSGSVAPANGSYNAGTAVPLTATATTGYHFVNWSGDASGTAAATSVTMNSSKNVTANFALNITTYTLSTSVLPAGSGTIALNPAGGSYNAGTTVTVTALPCSGYTFVSWSGASSSTNSSIQVDMNSNQSLTAAFQLIPVNQWLSSGTNLYYNNGNVGIGTNSPGSKLTVNGEISTPSIHLSQNSADTRLAGGTLEITSTTGGSSIIGQTITTGNLAARSSITAGNIVASSSITAGNIVASSSITAGNIVANRTIQADTLICNGIRVAGSTSDVLLDIDGNVYHTVKIGTQTWTVENLATTRFRDSTPIANVTDDHDWISLTTPGYCWYDNSRELNAVTFGALYNWYAVRTGGLAPAGWHVAEYSDWMVLFNYCIAHGYNWDGTRNSSNKIAQSLAAKTEWTSSGTIGTVGNNLNRNNRTGFSAIPSGSRFQGFSNVFSKSYWWCSSEYDAYSADCWQLGAQYEYLGRSFVEKYSGLAVRLVKD